MEDSSRWGSAAEGVLTDLHICYTSSMSYWRSWKYKNLTFFVLSIIIAAIVFRFESLHSFLLHFGKLGYVGAFVAGIFFVSSFTVATGAVLLLILAEKLSLFEMMIVAGFGAMIGDFVIFFDSLKTISIMS